MAGELLSPARLRRLGQALRVELRLWLHTVIAGSAVSFVLWTVLSLALAFVEAPIADELAGGLPAALGWAGGAAGVLLALFVARGLAVGLSDTFVQAEERAQAVTVTGVAAAVALACGALIFAWPARAETVSASTADYCARDLGSWFYCARPAAPEPQESAREEGDLNLVKPPEIVELEAFQKEIEEARAVAVWAPTEENVRRYYLLQKTALDRGGLFADQWRRLVWTNPELDYTLKRPVSEIGKRAWQDERLYDRELFLKAAAPELGLFYVFRESCGACRIFSPVVKAFESRYAVAVKAISADGGRNADFPNAVADQGQLKAWGFASPATPALMIFQRSSKAPPAVEVSGGKTLTLRPCRQPKGCLTYLGAGVMSVEDIAERLFVLLATRPGEDF
jgi:conjugal transfer pilus assembly protein TraF